MFIIFNFAFGFALSGVEIQSDKYSFNYADERTELKTAVGGKSIPQITRELLDALDPDKQIEQAIAQFQTPTPTETQQQQAAEVLINLACQPFDNPQFRNLLKNRFSRT